MPTKDERTPYAIILEGRIISLQKEIEDLQHSQLHILMDKEACRSADAYLIKTLKAENRKLLRKLESKKGA